eukprot:scaffold53157_cov36-Cyclotella_meneghiniana.AAC.1
MANYQRSGIKIQTSARTPLDFRSPSGELGTQCCGYTETLKLHVYGLVNHPIAVHLDLDSLLLRPMDDLFDAMLAPKTSENPLPLAKGPKTKTPDYTIPIDAAFTRDYNQVNDPKPEAQ